MWMWWRSSGSRPVSAAGLFRAGRGGRPGHRCAVASGCGAAVGPAAPGHRWAGRGRADPRLRPAGRRAQRRGRQLPLVAGGGAGGGGGVGGGDSPVGAQGAGGAAAGGGDRGRAAAGPTPGRIPPAGPGQHLRRPRPGDGAAGPRARPLRLHRLGHPGTPGSGVWSRPPSRPATTSRCGRLDPDLAAAAGRPAGLGVRHQRRDHLGSRRRAHAPPHLPGVLRRRRQPQGPPDRRRQPPRSLPVGLAGAGPDGRALVRHRQAAGGRSR